MNAKQFSDAVQLSNGSEIQKAILIGFYLLKLQNTSQFTISELCKLMRDFGVANPNPTRLRQNIVSSRCFIKGDGNYYKLKLKLIEELTNKYPAVSIESEEVIAEETVLPKALFINNRVYIVSVCNQINGCYQHNLFDGCAMLMRRLLEMLLILTYRHVGREDEIKTPHGGYHKLSTITNHYTQNKVIVLTKDSQDVIEDFRQLGNNSAHTIEYHARKVDIDRVRMSYRVCIEELMYKCGLIK